MGQEQLEKWAIITAGGSGKRMGSAIPKQFLELLAKPIVMYAIEAFTNTDAAIRIILVLPEHEIERWKALCKQYHFPNEHTIIAGGPTRFHSVKNGLGTIKTDNAVIAVHDGVRPILSTDLIERIFSRAERSGNAVPVIEMKESIRKVEGNINKVAIRDLYRIVQTPQCFRAEQIKPAFEQPYDPSLTDEASVVERAGNKIHLVEGEPENIKITTPADLTHAAALLSDR